MQRQRECSLLLLHKRTAKPQPCLRSASNAATSRWVHGEGSHALRLLPIRHRRSKRAGRFLALLRLRTPRAPNASASADLSAFAETPAARRLRDNQIRLESPCSPKPSAPMPATGLWNPRRADRHRLLRRLPLRPVHRAQRVGRHQLPLRSRPRDRGDRERRGRAGRESSRSATRSASDAWSEAANTATPATKGWSSTASTAAPSPTTARSTSRPATRLAAIPAGSSSTISSS